MSCTDLAARVMVIGILLLLPLLLLLLLPPLLLLLLQYVGCLDINKVFIIAHLKVSGGVADPHACCISC